MTAFGSSSMLVQLGTQIRDQGETMLVGALAGTTALGYWTVARRFVGVVVDLFASVVGMVAHPVFAKLQDDTTRLSRASSRASAPKDFTTAFPPRASASTPPIRVPSVSPSTAPYPATSPQRTSAWPPSNADAASRPSSPALPWRRPRPPSNEPLWPPHR